MKGRGRARQKTTKPMKPIYKPREASSTSSDETNNGLEKEGETQNSMKIVWEFYEYSLIFKLFQANPSCWNTLDTQDYSSSQKLEISRNSNLHFPGG